jgi:hypothetical protein
VIPKNLTLERAENIHRRRQGDSMTTEQLGEAILRTVRAMNPDQKAHLRAKLNRSVGIASKSSEGKPS